MSFAKWVSLEAIALTTFNYWEPSYMLSKGGRAYTAYHTQVPDTLTNVVVIEGFRRLKDGRRCDLYFRAFEGKHTGQCETAKDGEPFMHELEATIARKYRVRGRDLEQEILRHFEK
jgi:hypothetical protein